MPSSNRVASNEAIMVDFNGQAMDARVGESLAEFIDRLGKDPNQLATAVNAEFVPRDMRKTLLLQQGDAIMTFEPITGG